MSSHPNCAADACSSPATPRFEPTAPLLFVINTSSGDTQLNAKRAVIESALALSGRTGELIECDSQMLEATAARAAATALELRSAVVAVGGDGSLNAVAKAAHAAGCVMGIVPYGTFNYFARSHGIPDDPAQAMRALLCAQPTPVQVSAINEQVFLVNASLGVYPELLEDREALKARWGRSRWVAWAAALGTALRAHRRLHLSIDTPHARRAVQTLTLFVVNNHLQLTRLGAEPGDDVPGEPGRGSLAAIMLKPVSTAALLALTLRGAVGQLGGADSVESFEFQSLQVSPRTSYSRRRIKVAFDGEVAHMDAPLHIRVLPQPLYLLKSAGASLQP